MWRHLYEPNSKELSGVLDCGYDAEIIPMDEESKLISKAKKKRRGIYNIDIHPFQNA
jgi:hypothetical protein